jgi:hypothetical protein
MPVPYIADTLRSFPTIRGVAMITLFAPSTNPQLYSYYYHHTYKLVNSLLPKYNASW